MPLYGKIAYDKYRMDQGGKDQLSGKLLPAWEFLSPRVKLTWYKTAIEVVKSHVQHVRETKAIERVLEEKALRKARSRAEIPAEELF